MKYIIINYTLWTALFILVAILTKFSRLHENFVVFSKGARNPKEKKNFI